MVASLEPMPVVGPSLRLRAGAAFAAVTLTTALGGASLGASLGVGPLYPLKAALLVPLLGVLSAPAFSAHGRPELGWANAITLVRAGLAGLLAGFLGESVSIPAAWTLVALGSVGFVLDWVDGKVARATGTTSPWGARLDLELDALTVMALAALVWQLGHAGAWVLLSGLLRYAFVAAGWALPWMNRPLFPAERRRFVCGVQVTCLILAVAPMPAWFTVASAAVGLVALIGSFAVDTTWLFQRRAEPL